MAKMFSLGLVSFCAFFCIVQSLEVQVLTGNFSQRMNFTLNSTIRYVLIFQPQQDENPYRIKAWTTSANSILPVLVGVELEQNTVSWSVPLVFKTSSTTQVSYKNTSRILCDNHLLQDKMQKVQSFTVSLATLSLLDVDLTLEVAEDVTFYITSDENYTVSISPSQPQYFFYKFKGTENDTVFIEIDSSDDVCLTASIQQNNCPVFDLDEDISNAGVHQTIMTKGGMRIDRQNFPDGFFLVFVAKVDDYLCNTRLGPFSNPTPRIRNARVSTVNFFISVDNNGYKLAALIVFGIIIGFSLIAITIICTFFYLGKNSYCFEDGDDNVATDNTAGCNQEEIGENETLNGQTTEQGTEIREQSVGEDEDANTTQDSTNEESTLIISERHVNSKTVEDLSQNEEANSKRSHRYFKYTLNLAIFYIIPVIHVMVTYQRVVNSTDFNHVYSNIGYLMMGVLFLGVVRHRQWYMCKKQTGIPTHYGIFYAMGTALIAEAGLSGCYHICPNMAQFQFDTSFMYVMAVLCMVKLYENRHSDITPSACSTFFGLAVIIFFAMVGLLEAASERKYRIILGCVVGIGYFVLCIYISLKMYYFGTVLRQLKQLWDQRLNFFETLRPQAKARFMFLLIVNIFNYTASGILLYFYINNTFDFGTVLLILLLANALLYTITYTYMKKTYGERIVVQAIIYGLVALAFWSAALVCFLKISTTWKLSPAQSRIWNQECIFLQFYDTHDLWHLLSAAALFLTFMYLLCVDDDIIHKNRKEIPVF